MKFIVPKVNSILNMGIFCMILKAFFASSIIVPYNSFMDNILVTLSTSLLTVEIIRNKARISVLLICIALGIFSIYSTSLSGHYPIIISLLTIIAIKDSDIDDIINFIFRYQLLLIVIHTLYSLISAILLGSPIGIVISGIYKFHFGLVHPNLLGIYIFNLVVMWIWLNYERINTRIIINILLIQVLTFILTRSDTGLICTIVLLLIISTKDNSMVKNIINNIAKFIVPIAAALYIFASINYKNNAFLEVVNQLITGRIKLSAFAYEKLGPTLFGQYVPNSIGYWDTEWKMSIFKFDNIYMYLVVQLGIVWLVLLSISFYKLAKAKNNKINIIIIIWALYGMTEVQGLNGILFFPILLISILFYQNFKTDKYNIYIEKEG